MNDAFFKVHRDIPRQGPGSAADVQWALEIAGTPEMAHILDAGCGPGADMVSLAEARPKADTLGLEITPHFVEEAAARVERFGERVRAAEGSYLELDGRYDLIWCAGAVYFHGIGTVLETWCKHMSPGGAVAFSEPSWMIEPPSEAARAFWAGEYEPKPLAAIEAEIHAAGWGILGQRWVVDAPWAEYYGPLSARLDQLEEAGAHGDLAKAVAQTRAEVSNWQAAREEVAYSLFVLRAP